MKKYFFVWLLVFSLAKIGVSQIWTYESDFACMKGPHGIAIDPDGKIWVGFYYEIDTIETPYGPKYVKPIRIYNPDGSPAPFSPIYSIIVEEDTTYLESGCRGISHDNNGNILYTMYDKIWLIDYHNGRGIHKAIPKNGTSLAKATCTADGYTIVGTVMGSNPIWIFDQNFDLYSIAEDSNMGLQRSIAVTPDGRDVYVGKIYSGCNGVVHYHSDTGVNGTYTRVDTIGTIFNPDGTVLKNMWVQSLDWDRNGLLWVGTYWDVGPNDFTGWYALDPTQDYAIVDSVGYSAGNFIYSNESPVGPTYFSPRGAAWSPDGHTMYTADFDGGVIKRWYNPNPIKPGGGGDGEDFLPNYPIAFKIRVSVSTNNLSDGENYAGAAFEAQDGFDQNIDLPEPPIPFQNYLQLYFPHPEWELALSNFTMDIQAPENLNYLPKVWNFKVATDQVGQKHTLRFIQTSGPSLGNHIFVKDLATGNIVRLYSNGIYEFTPTASGEYGFQLTVGRLFPVQEITKQFPAGWNMLGLPLTPIERTITNLFGDDISGYYYPYSYSNTSGYSLIENIVQGHGYWLGLLEPAILDFAGDSLTDTISISLPKGSNIIGNPFKHKIGKENLTFSKDGVTQSFSSAVANNLISNVMHTWKNVGSGVYAATDTLSVWWGAWLYALVDGLSVNYLPGAVSKSLTEKVMEIGEGWQVNLSLSAAWGKENSGFLGENASASDGFDALYDYIEPPEAPSGKFLRGFFRHDKWTEITTLYDSDIRPLKSPNAEWLYTVNSSQNGEVVLTWDIQNLPSDKSLTLITPDGSEIDLRQQKELTFKYNGEITFRIVKQFSTTIAEKRLLPDKFALQQNYPNPFNPVTTIKYQLPKAVKVELTVYNTIGQTARTIVNTHQEPGYYTVSFDASGLGSGVYFYRIKAGNFSDLKKCIVVK